MKVQGKCKFVTCREVLELFCAKMVTKESLFGQFTQKCIQICKEEKEEEKKSMFGEHDGLKSPLTDGTFHVPAESVGKFNNLSIHC